VPETVGKCRLSVRVLAAPKTVSFETPAIYLKIILEQKCARNLSKPGEHDLLLYLFVVRTQ
jgi:hypothetical protein